MTKEQLMKQVQEDKKKLEELKPKYEDALKICNQLQKEITEVKAEYGKIVSRLEEQNKEIKSMNNELNKARCVIGAEYLKGVEL